MIDHIKAPAPFEMTLSFERDPAEHVAVMFVAGRRFQGNDGSAIWGRLMVVIAFALVFGIIMELHRRYVLPSLFGRADFGSFGEMFFYFLPAFLLSGACLLGMMWWRFWQARGKLVARIRPNVLIGVDLSKVGVKMTTDDTDMFIHWSAIRHMEMDGSLILMDAGTFTLYIPERAFSGHKAFVAGFHRIQTLWRHGMESEIAGRDHLR